MNPRMVKAWVTISALALGMACGGSFNEGDVREKGANQGSRKYQNEMGVAYQDPPQINVQPNYPLALVWYEAAATPTNHVIQSGDTLVEILSRYRVRDERFKEANPNLDLGKFSGGKLEPGTELVIPGLPDAMYNAGALLEQRYADLKRTEKEALAEAAIWYLKGAKAEHRESQFMYGYALETGRGVELNLREAGSFHELAARRGLAEAQQRLAMLHFNGFGELDKKDTSKAYEWASIAKKTYQQDLVSAVESKKEGLQQAIDSCETVATSCAKSLSAGERGRVDRIIQAFQPQR